MARININVGTNANDGTGDDLRAAMQKINTNFTELYAETAVDSGITISGNTISSNRSDDDIVFEPSGTGAVRFPAVTINDNSITGTRSNEDLTISASGTGNLILGALRVNGTTVSSDDSSKITLAESVDITGTLTAAIFQVNELSSSDSSAIQVNDGLNVSGTLSADVLDVNEISSGDSSAIQVNDGLNVSGTLVASSFVTNTIISNDSSAIQILDGLNVSGAITTNSTFTANGTLTANTIVTNDISSGDSTAIQINDAVNISGTLSANVLDVNEISSSDSSAIQIDDAVNIAGNVGPSADNTYSLGSATARWHTLYVGPGSINIGGVTLSVSGGKLNMGADIEVNAISSGDSSAIQINDGVNISGTTHLHGDLTVTGDLITLGRTTTGGSGSVGMSGTRILGSLELTNPNGNSTMAMGMSFTGASGGEGQMIFESNNASGYALVPSNNNQYTLGRPEVAGPGSAAYWKNLYVYNVNFPDSTEQTTAARITVVGDDSTGVTLNAGETIKIAGAGGVTTAVSGDTLTITGNLGNLSITESTITSTDSSAININENLNVDGTLTAPTITTNNISSSDSTAIQINDDVNISGTTNTATLFVNDDNITIARRWNDDSTRTSSEGKSGDTVGMIAWEDDAVYVCIANYDGSTVIWRRAALSTF